MNYLTENYIIDIINEFKESHDKASIDEQKNIIQNFVDILKKLDNQIIYKLNAYIFRQGSLISFAQTLIEKIEENGDENTLVSVINDGGKSHKKRSKKQTKKKIPKKRSSNKTNKKVSKK